MDAAGQVVHRFNTAMDAAGLRKLIGQLERHAVDRVAIERPDGPVVDALLAADIAVVVITPRQVKNLRSRYGSAGNKDDRFDAFVLADTLRTDPGRLVALTPDTPQTLALRAAVRARTDLVETRVALCNQLRAHLRIVYPGAVGLFNDLDSPISLTFLTRVLPSGLSWSRGWDRVRGFMRRAGGYLGASRPAGASPSHSRRRRGIPRSMAACGLIPRWMFQRAARQAFGQCRGWRQEVLPVVAVPPDA